MATLRSRKPGGAADGSDVFLVPRVIFTPEPTPQEVSGTPAPEALAPAWRLGLTARSQADGSVLVQARVPGLGSLQADAMRRCADRAPEASGWGRGARRGRARFAVAARLVADGKLKASDAERRFLSLRLKLSPSYRALAERAGGLSSTLTVVFSAPGDPRLRQKLLVTFVRKRSRASHRDAPRRA